MQVPQIAHLKASTLFNLITGTWTFITDKTSFLYRCYTIYSWIFLLASIYFIVATYVEIYLLMFYKFDLRLLTNNAISVTVYSIGLYRGISIKTNEAKNLIQEIWDKEKQIMNSNDKGIIDTYNENVRKNSKVNWFYWLLFAVDSTVYLYIIYPIFLPKQLYYNPATNETIYEKPLPLSPYFPFDPHKYHILAYLVEEIGCSVCIFINYGTDTLFYSFMSYVLGQIDILKYFLNNFDSYSKKIKGQLDCDDDKADFVTMQLCISEHQRIIRYINNYNDAMRNVMLFDFLQSSFQLAVIAIYLLYEPFLVARIGCEVYAVIMLIRLGIYYWYATEIMTKSWEIGDILYDTDWYNKSKKLKSLMVVFIMRCNKQTGLQIGSLSIMTWSIFIGIMKGAYSFITFVLQRSN